MHIPFDNSFSRLPSQFFDFQDPTPVAAPKLVKLNTDLATMLGLEPDGISADMLAGNAVPVGATPIATAYAGHQFGGFVPQLGDGRAVLLGEIAAPSGRFDIQLKGSGRTAFSRGGDGRATLGAVLREYVVSEAMFALGIPTTRALAAVTTGEIVPREQPFPGAVLSRVAASHIRVGTFQYHYNRQDTDALQTLTDYVINRHYPDARTPVELLQRVMQRQADLVARWMGVGFIHGVMNTDNMAISGETIDYGPCAFMDIYHSDKVFSSIDRQGRYAYSNQARLAHWNLSQFAGTLVPLVGGADDLQATLDGFEDLFRASHLRVFNAKLGGQADAEMIRDILTLMGDGQVDFTLFFRHLTQAADSGDFTTVRALFPDPTGFDAWRGGWQGADVAIMQSANPIYIPRNHRIESMIDAANKGDFALFETLTELLQSPYREQPEFARYEQPPNADEQVHATFCGT